jgi:hypothetical protein
MAHACCSAKQLVASSSAGYVVRVALTDHELRAQRAALGVAARALAAQLSLGALGTGCERRHFGVTPRACSGELGRVRLQRPLALGTPAQQ